MCCCVLFPVQRHIDCTRPIVDGCRCWAQHYVDRWDRRVLGVAACPPTTTVQWDPEVGAPKSHCEDDRCHQCRVVAFDNLPLKDAPPERIGLPDRGEA